MEIPDQILKVHSKEIVILDRETHLEIPGSKLINSINNLIKIKMTKDQDNRVLTSTEEEKQNKVDNEGGKTSAENREGQTSGGRKGEQEEDENREEGKKGNTESSGKSSSNSDNTGGNRSGSGSGNANTSGGNQSGKGSGENRGGNR